MSRGSGVSFDHCRLCSKCDCIQIVWDNLQARVWSFGVMLGKMEWDALSPLNKMDSAVQLAGFHYITSLKARAGNENCELYVKGNTYSFENIRTFDSSTLAWEYQCWAARCVLRDLVESFSSFLTAVYQAIESKSSKGLSISGIKFEMLGVEDQSKTFKANFNIDDRWFVMFDGLNRARNCLSHRQGIVSLKDVNNNGALSVSWLKINWSISDQAPTQFVDAAGHYTGLIRGEQLAGSDAIDICIVRTEKRFNIGEILVFEPEDILQICSTFTTLASLFSRVEE
jgi:hypothetical protein